MLAILNSKPIFSKDGKPVHGRINIFQKDTNQKATVYTYDTNKSLVESQNPVYTDIYGFPEYEVILDDQIYSIVVEEYLGNYDDPKADERETSWNVCNSYYEGVTEDEASSSIIYTATNLPEADISLGEIQVIGYHTPFDCDSRIYVWDEEAIDTADNGYVFKSNKSSTGRWILINSFPYIPSEYYGVYPGHIENISKLTSCPETVGKLKKVTVPNCIKFATGTYALADLIATNSNGRTRSILVDNNTCFGNEKTVQCQGITVLGEVEKDQGKYIGKLILPANTEAKYSWFPSLQSFMECGADVLVVDSYGIDNELTENSFAKFKTFRFAGGRISWTSSSNSTLTIEQCQIEGHHESYTNAGSTAWWNGFSSNTIFKNMAYSDKFVLGGGNARLSNCTYDIDDFDNLDNFFAICAADSNVIDLQGHTVPNAVISNAQSEITITNGTMSNLQIAGSRSKLTLENCKVENLIMTYGLESFTISHSEVTGNIEASVLKIIDSHINGTIDCLESMYAKDSEFESSIEAYTVGFYNCIIKNVVWPKSDAGTITCVFVGNTFTTDSYIKLASKNSEEQVKLIGHFENNSFFSTQYNGLYVQVFVADNRYLNDDVTTHIWTWQGNSGTCLQTACYNWLHLDSTAATSIDNLRFISFGIPWHTAELTHEPYVMTITPEAGTPWAYAFRYTDESADYCISKYSTTDYFAHRIKISNFTFDDDFYVEVITCNRRG